jgi:hypothetical protein
MVLLSMKLKVWVGQTLQLLYRLCKVLAASDQGRKRSDPKETKGPSPYI